VNYSRTRTLTPSFVFIVTWYSRYSFLLLQGSALAINSGTVAVSNSQIRNGRTGHNGGGVFTRNAKVSLTSMTFLCNLDIGARNNATDVLVADDLDPTKDGSFVSCDSPDAGIIVRETLNGGNAFVNTNCPFTDPCFSGCPV
jgi:hypothetical protein